tara:strand:+ start:76 stop:498 length:423 start_codon:yes stop_codon:yes gene_type:complete
MNLLALTARLDRLEQTQNSVPGVKPAGAAGVTATAHAGGSFARGAYIEIAAASSITSKYRPTAVILDNLSAGDEFEVDLAVGGAGSETVVATIRVCEHGRKILTSCPYVDANARLAARIGCRDAVARTAGISVEFIDSLS